jgi:hypothetical protein
MTSSLFSPLPSVNLPYASLSAVRKPSSNTCIVSNKKALQIKWSLCSAKEKNIVLVALFHKL